MANEVFDPEQLREVANILQSINVQGAQSNAKFSELRDTIANFKETIINTNSSANQLHSTLTDIGDTRPPDMSANLKQLQSAMELAGKVRANLPDLAAVLNKEGLKEVVSGIKELESEIVKMGGDMATLTKIRQQEKQLIGAELLDMSKLTFRARARLKLEQALTDERKRYVRVGGELVEVESKQVRSFKESSRAWGQRAKSVGQYASSMAGIQLSVVGLIALLIKLNDINNRIGAMSQQVAAQWAKSPGNLKAAAGEIGKIRSGFKRTWDVAGQYVVSLSRAGFEKENLVKLSKELMAVEFVQGQSVQEQIGYIQGLVTNFGKAGTEASGLLAAVRENAKTIPMLSMSEAVGDWAELIDKTKVYNTDLLGTLGLYNTLIRKDVAEKLGLGDAPRAVRKEIVKTIAGFSNELEDGWKAALGEGTSAAARILEFEKLIPAEQFARMAEFITEKTQQFTGDTREIAVRNLLKQFGFASKEVQKALGEAFAKGKFDEAGLQNFMKVFQANKKSMQDAKDAAEANRKALIKQGMNIATNLTGTIERLQQWVENKLLPVFQDLVAAINSLTKSIPSFVQESRKQIEKGLEKTVTGMKIVGEVAKEFVAPGLERGLERRRTIRERFGGAEQQFGKLMGLRGFERFKEAGGLERLTKLRGVRRGISEARELGIDPEMAKQLAIGRHTSAIVRNLKPLFQKLDAANEESAKQIMKEIITTVEGRRAKTARQVKEVGKTVTSPNIIRKGG
jgi:hypothetical protein